MSNVISSQNENEQQSFWDWRRWLGTFVFAGFYLGTTFAFGIIFSLILGWSFTDMVANNKSLYLWAGGLLTGVFVPFWLRIGLRIQHRIEHTLDKQ